MNILNSQALQAYTGKLAAIQAKLQKLKDQAEELQNEMDNVRAAIEDHTDSMTDVIEKLEEAIAVVIIACELIPTTNDPKTHELPPDTANHP